MVVGVGFCQIKVDSNFSSCFEDQVYKNFIKIGVKTVDLHTKYTNKQAFSFIYIYNIDYCN
jgi:hypothetical protein